MILVPQRLFGLSSVHCLFQTDDFCLLHKTLSESSLNRDSYLGQPAISLVRQGTQHISLIDGGRISIEAGRLAFLPQGMYNITDLLAQEGRFESLIFFFSSEQIHQFLQSQPLPTSLPQQAKTFQSPTTPPGFLSRFRILITNWPT